MTQSDTPAVTAQSERLVRNALALCSAPELIHALSMKLSPIRGAWAGAQPQQVAGESVVALYHYTSVAET